MDSTLRRTWAEIDLDALAHNYHTLCRHMGEHTALVGVVKADAYGHGSVQVGRALQELGAAYLAVSSTDEALELRSAGITAPILQLGLTPWDQTELLVRHRITQSVYSLSMANRFSAASLQAGGRLKVHIKLDTGMSRLGFLCAEERFEQSVAEVAQVCSLPGLEVEGIFTHFAAADDVAEDDYTQLQHRRFTAMLERLRELGISIPLTHCANSGAVALYPEFGHHLYRPGLLTYGLADGYAKNLDLKPLMTLKSTVGVIQTYPAETTVSYGRTAKLRRASRVGVIPIGYADGLHRSLSNCWSVWTPAGRAPILGRICMDMCMIDLTDLPQVQEGDEVEVYGIHNSVIDAAAAAGTIPYELVCAVSKRVPRIYYRNGKEVCRELLLRG